LSRQDVTSAEPPDGPAWDHPPTQRAVRRFRRIAWAAIAVSLLFMVTFMEVASVGGDRADELEATGTRASGTVVSVRSTGRFADDGAVTVRYEARGRSREAVVHLNEESDSYEEGQAITVIYDPADPDRATIAGEDNDPPWMVAVFIITFVGWFVLLPAGIVLRLRARRWRRIFERHPWRRRSLRYGEVGSGRTLRPVVKLGGDGSVLGVSGTLRPRLKALRAADGTQVWVAGDISDELVLAPPGPGPLFGARPARTRWTKGRWARAFD
jgi:hypothetical protein